MRLRYGIVAAVLALSLQVHLSQAVTIVQVDDFQDGTTMGWAAGAPHPYPPANVADAGPGGAGDGALRLIATGGGGAGSKLVSFNKAQWTGDYTDAGVTAISMALSNTGGTELDVRLAINGPGGKFSTTSAFTLPAGNGWGTYQFPIEAADWTSVSGGSNIGTPLAGATELRIVNNPSPSFIGVGASATLLVDNIDAVPEPGTFGLLAVAGMVWVCSRRRVG